MPRGLVGGGGIPKPWPLRELLNIKVVVPEKKSEAITVQHPSASELYVERG